MRWSQAITVALLLACLAAKSAQAQIRIDPVGTYAGSGAEIAAYDPITRRLFSINPTEDTLDVLDLSDPTRPLLVLSLSLGSNPNSVAVHGDVVAVAVEGVERTDPGVVIFVSTNAEVLNSIIVGALPDMLTFTPDGTKVLVANEGEPNDSYSTDPEGSVSIIDVSRGAAHVTQDDVVTATFSGFTRDSIDPDIRIFGPNDPTVAQDLEPEYLAVSHDSRTAWVTLQENNALAILDIRSGLFTDLVALRTKDHEQPGNALDTSDRDGRINVAHWPVRGMYQPDAIASYRVGQRTYLVTANEGDGRDYPGFSEEVRVGAPDFVLDPDVFPNAATLKQNENLGRLTVSKASGDVDRDGDYDQIHVFGARSFSIWSDRGTSCSTVVTSSN